MIWADRLGIVWGIVILLACIQGKPAAIFDPEVIKAIAVLAGGPWLFCRALHFLLTGRLRGRAS